jgi:hypothetical protein
MDEPARLQGHQRIQELDERTVYRSQQSV